PSAPAWPPVAWRKSFPPSSAAPTPHSTGPRKRAAIRSTWPRSGWWREAWLGAQNRTHLAADLAEIDPAGIIGLELGDDLAHVLGALGTRRGDCSGNGHRHFLFRQPLGQEFVENIDLFLFHRGEVRAPRLGIDGKAFFALLHHLLDHGQNLVIGG